MCDPTNYEQEIDSLNKINKKLLEKERIQFSKNCELEIQNQKFKKLILELKIENIAELKASKILFKMVSKGYTHRQKNEIANYANIILINDIEDKIKDLSVNDTDLPF